MEQLLPLVLRKFINTELHLFLDLFLENETLSYLILSSQHANWEELHD